MKDMELLKSPQASTHWSVRLAYCGNPGRATVLGKADSAMKVVAGALVNSRVESDWAIAAATSKIREI